MYSQLSKRQANGWIGNSESSCECQAVISGKIAPTIKEARKIYSAYFKSLFPFGSTRRAYDQINKRMASECETINEVRREIVRLFYEVVYQRLSEASLYSSDFFQIKSSVGDDISGGDDVSSTFTNGLEDDLVDTVIENIYNAVEYTGNDVEVCVRANLSDKRQHGILCEVHDQGKGPNTEEWLSNAREVQKKASQCTYAKLRRWVNKKYLSSQLRLPKFLHPGSAMAGVHRGNGKARILRSAIVRTGHEIATGGCNTLTMIGPFEITNALEAAKNSNVRGAYAACFDSLPEYRHASG